LTRQLRYEGVRLDDVLARVREEHGPDANIVSADLTRRGGVGGFFARETFEVVVELESEPAPPAAPIPSTPTPATAPPLEQRRGPTSQPAAPQAATAPPVQPAPAAAGLDDAPPPPRFAAVPAQPAAVAPGEFARMLADMIDDPDPLSSEPTPIVPPDLLVTNTGQVPALGGTPMAEPTDVAPIGIGELLGQLNRMIKPIRPVPDHGVVAVVGPRGDAVEVGLGLAQACGRAPSEVMVAAPTDPGVTPATIGIVVAESSRRRHQRGQAGPTIVVVSVMPGMDGHRWAAETLAAIAPTQIRLAVAGWRPIDRVAQTLAGIGGVDVIDLVSLDGATAPEAFLRLGVPVATIDGQEATATLWAALLVDCGRAGALTDELVVAGRTERPASDASAAPAEDPPPAVFPQVPSAQSADR
jgi:hypothetical protein